MYTVKEVYVKTGIPEHKIYYQIAQEKIKASWKYGRYLISGRELNRIIKLEEEKRKQAASGTIEKGKKS